MHILNVTATYANGVQTSTTVIVSVNDVDDTSPTIAAPTSAVITSTHTTGSLVNAVFASDPENSALTYTITAGNGAGLFAIDAKGVITTTRCIADTEMGQHSLTVSVSDSLNAAQSAVYPINIRAGDDRSFNGQCGLINYGTPVQYLFKQGVYNLDLPEQVYPKTLLNKFSLGFDFVNATWSLSGGDSSIFSVDDTGTLYVEGEADYEQNRVYHFKVNAQIPSFAGVLINSSAAVIVSIKDLDDTAPTVTPTTLTLSVSETSHLGNVVGCLHAHDVDTTSALIYSISSGNGAGIFRISQNGELIVNKTVDADTQNRNYQLEVRVSDGTQSSISVVNILIQDTNDHVPTFDQSVYTSAISETATVGTIVTTIIARDQDATVLHNSFTYALSGDGSSIFTINATTGAIKTVTDLDYETRKAYHFVVTATDQGGFQGIATLTINVVDVNDNAPSMITSLVDAQGLLISHPVHEYTLVGSSILKIEASDADTSDALTYAIVGIGDPGNMFAIDNITGVITISKSLSLSKGNSYELDLTVTDSANNAITGKLLITVTRAIPSDSGCINFDMSSSGSNYIDVKEDTAVGTTLADISIKNLAIASSFQYSLAKQSVVFTLSEAGVLSLAGALDYETEQEYTLYVTVNDTFRTIAQSYILNVRVLDVSEGPHVISSDTISVSESTPAGEHFGTVDASDVDTFAQLRCSIGYRDDNGIFEIDPVTCKLRHTSSLDFDTAPTSHTLEVCVHDARLAVPVKVCKNITVAITNVNDNAPAFSMAPMQLAFNDSVSANTHISNVVASDADGDVITYSLSAASQGVAEHVSIDSASGKLQFIKKPSVGTMQFLVCASDGIFRSCMPVTIVITPSNLANPVFDPEMYQIVIPFDSAVGSEVISVVATDEDSQLTYSFGADSEFFEIGALTGLIRTKKAFDGSKFVFNLTVKADDGGPKPAYAYVLIVVNQRSNANSASRIVSISGVEMTVNFSLAGFDLTKIERFEIIGQEYDGGMSDIASITLLPPSTYYLTHQQQTVGDQQSSYRYHRYLIDSVTPNDILSKVSKRKRREVSSCHCPEEVC